MTTTENIHTAEKQPQFIIGRSYNRHGISDYYMGKDENDGQFCFSAKCKAKVYTNCNEAYGMTLRLKRLLPTIMGGSPASYTVVEMERKATEKAEGK